jgi:peptidoglycan hydrolase FlgJ
MSPLQPPSSPLATPLATPNGDPKAQLTKVAQQFEAIFVRQMLAEARKNHLGGEDLFGGQGMDTFRQMQDDRFADIAAERGSFGLAKMIEAQLSKQVGAAPTPKEVGT